jgi:hypothetical protein
MSLKPNVAWTSWGIGLRVVGNTQICQYVDTVVVHYSKQCIPPPAYAVVPGF